MNKAVNGILTPYRYIKHSLYRKILVSFLAIVTLTVISLETNYYVETSADLKQRAISNMEQSSDQSAKMLGSYIKYIKDEAWSYFGDTEFQSFVQRMDTDPDPEQYSYFMSKFRKLMADNPIISVAVVNPLNGTPLVVGNNTNIYYGNSIQSELFESERKRLQDIALENNGKGAWVISQKYDSKAKRKVNTLVFVQALKEIKVTSQRIIGTLMMEMSLDELNNWLGSTENREQGARFYLADRLDGSIILAEDASVLGKPVLDKTSLNELQQNDGEKHTFLNIEGTETLVVNQEIPGSDWLIVGKVPVNHLLKQVNEVARRTILIGLAYILGSMLLAGLLSSRVIKPLKRLRKGMKQIETGNFNISVPVETEDEIGYFCLSFNQMANEINRLVVKVYEAELVKKDAEIKALQSQINPHFLYNTLGTIDSLASMHEDRRISVITRSLAKMFRYNVSGGSMSSLGEEIRQIELYLSIQKIRYASRLDYSISIESGLESMLLPKLLFQPLVENSIIHAIETMSSGGFIRIQAVSIDDRDAEIRVWNNGGAIAEQRLKEIRTMLDNRSRLGQYTETKASIGLVNVQERLKLIYGEPYGLTIQSCPEQGTVTTLRVSKTIDEGGE